MKLSAALIVFLFLFGNTVVVCQTKKRSLPHEVFKFKYYVLLKDKSDAFDSVALWHNAKLKKTFVYPGRIIINHSFSNVRIKLNDDGFEENNSIFRDSPGMIYMTNGKRLFRFTDAEKGKAVAVYQFNNGQWIIYYQKGPLTNLKR